MLRYFVRLANSRAEWQRTEWQRKEAAGLTDSSWNSEDLRWRPDHLKTADASLSDAQLSPSLTYFCRLSRGESAWLNNYAVLDGRALARAFASPREVY
jgi:hypothetical protein